jgi:XTP/dITP diphosphohydrolase
MKLLLATHNKDKVIELKGLLSQHPAIEIVTLADLNIDEEVDETESSFEGNATLKARWAAKQSGLIALADDSGLEIDALDKAPGVQSARYLGKETPYDIKNALILERLKDCDDRRARFISVVAIAFPKQVESAQENTDIILCRGVMEGSIAYGQKGNNGFGYDPIFLPEGFNETYAQMTTSDKNKVSHRGQAFGKAVKILTQGDTQ